MDYTKRQLETELILIEGEYYVTDLKIAIGFNKPIDGVRRLLSRHFRGLQSIKYSETLNARPQRIYLLSDEDVMILPAILDVNDEIITFQKCLVKEFVAMKKILATPQLPTDPKSQALMLATQLMESEKEIKELESANKNLVDTTYRLSGFIESNKPKVAFAESVMKGKSAISLDSFIKDLGIKDFGRNLFAKWLIDNLYMFKKFCGYSKKTGKEQYYNCIYQMVINSGIMCVETSYKTFPDGTREAFNPTPRITGKGVVYFRRRLKEWLESTNQMDRWTIND